MVRAGSVAAAAFVLLGPCGTAAQNADDHTQICAGAADPQMCESYRTSFRAEYPKAYRGDYQSQRNVAHCLSDGCHGSVRTNATLACAWRGAILLSGSPRVDINDQNNFRLACGGLDPAEAATAKAQTARILKTARGGRR